MPLIPGMAGREVGQVLTSFLSADGQLLAWLAAADLVEGIHADAVHGCRVQVYNVGLVDGGGDVACGLLEVPGIWRQVPHFKAQPGKL